MPKHNCLRCTASLLWLFSCLLFAQTNNAQLSIPQTSQSITIDGELNDAAWNNALNVSLNIVNAPWSNLPSPVKTNAKIIENGKYIYVSFIASDPEPDKIHGFLADRDTTWTDDLVGIKLDTFNSRQLSYNFLVNPFGVQNDSINNEITGDENRLWDGNWHSFGKKTTHGYQVEMAIPYSILNFADAEKEQTWAIEFIRLYPRDERLRISHVPINKNNNCWLCQLPEIKSAGNKSSNKVLSLIPSFVGSNTQQRDVFSPEQAWNKQSNLDAGIDIKWGPNTNTLLNVTINPDFSTVESDAGQLNVNSNNSLFYDEKRTFFLENSDYFSSNYNLIYTRNIAAPDYGVKLTSRTTTSSYGLFITNDQQTNFIVPGNISDDIAILDTESHSAAFNYRYNIHNNLTVGVVSTLRAADHYHNAVMGIDAKYRFNDSHTFAGQFLYSNTQYPTELVDYFCTDTSCKNQINTDCKIGNCAYNEQAKRTNIQDDFSDQAYRLDYEYETKYWNINLNHQKIDNLFRADLGFMTKADYQKNEIDVVRLFYGDKDDFWSESTLYSSWDNTKNENGEFIERSFTSGFELIGPKLSYIDISLTQAKKTGLRHNDSILNITNNTSLFDELIVNLYAEFQPSNRLYAAIGYDFGDKIDYNNNRLGSFDEVYIEFISNLTDHLNVTLTHTYSELTAKPQVATSNDNVYTANLTNLRIAYQFDVQSYLRLNVEYIDVQYNINNNPLLSINKVNKDLSTQLIYSYKLNPQTVFFLGYSDISFQNDRLSSIQRSEKTFFTKISYAWSL